MQAKREGNGEDPEKLVEARRRKQRTLDSPTAPGFGRRAFLGGALAAAGGMAMAQDAKLAPQPKVHGNALVYQFKIGGFHAWSISDGHLLFLGPLDLMWPREGQPQMKEWLEIHGEWMDGIPLDVNILVVRMGKEIAIFDAGFGERDNANLGWLQDGLKQAGMIQEVCRQFEILKGVSQPVKSGTQFFNGAVTVEAAPGHTAGHAVFRITSGNETLLHLMDLSHHHGFMFHNPEWYIAFDHDPLQSIDTRKKVFAKAAAERTRCYGFHVPWPGIGQVVPVGAGYLWHPERWSWGS